MIRNILFLNITCLSLQIIIVEISFEYVLLLELDSFNQQYHMLGHKFHSRHIYILPPIIRNFLLHIGRKRYRTNMLMLSTIIYFLAFYSFSSFIPVDAKMIFPSTSFFHSQNFGLNELRITMKVNHLLKQLNGYFGT